MSENTLQTNQGDLPTQTAEQLPETRDSSRYLVPAVDIYETHDGLTVVADVPGVHPDGVDIHVENGVLTLKGRVERAEDTSHAYEEYALIDYFRQFRLSEQVDTENITANLARGVLTVHLPKAAAAMPRHIKVDVA